MQLCSFFQDAYPLGEISLGAAKDGFEVTESLPDHLGEYPHMFMLKVPYRSKGGFPLLAESEQQKKDWMSALKTVIDNLEVGVIAAVAEDVVNCYEDEKEFSLSFSGSAAD